MMLAKMKQALDFVLGRNTPRVRALHAAASDLRKKREEFRTEVNRLGMDVFKMVETGDPLRALVHGARGAQFRDQMAEDMKDVREINDSEDHNGPR